MSHEPAGGAADVLLAHGYFLAEDEKEQQIMRPYPPLGLMYLSAYLAREALMAEAGMAKAGAAS